jgi:hypothetical protein
MSEKEDFTGLPAAVPGEEQTPSLRLAQVLRTYCARLSPDGLRDLRSSLARGRYPWLRDELAAALTSADVPSSWWREAVGDPGDAVPPGARGSARAGQIYLWQVLFPAEPFPGSAGASG